MTLSTIMILIDILAVAFLVAVFIISLVFLILGLIIPKEHHVLAMILVIVGSFGIGIDIIFAVIGFANSSIINTLLF